MKEIEQRIAAAWRAREISFYQRIIEAARHDSALNEAEITSVCRFAAQEIFRLNIASDDDVLRQYRIYREGVISTERAFDILMQDEPA